MDDGFYKCLIELLAKSMTPQIYAMSAPELDKLARAIEIEQLDVATRKLRVAK